MRVKSFKIVPCHRNDIKDFVETWHYSRSINGVRSDHCFKLMDGDRLIGAIIYGKMAMANQWKKYASAEEDVIELRRLCCIDDTPKNTESRLIGQSLRWIARNTNYKTVVSYADKEYGHEGVIYKASNFLFAGTTSPGKVIIFNQKKYHDKCIRTKYKGDLKPFALRIKKALDTGEAYYSTTKGKNIYTYNLRESKRDNPCRQMSLNLFANN